MTDHEKRIREALLIAAINCPHEITEDRITLYFNAAKPGHNALNQLSTRLEEANSALLADLDAVRGALEKLTFAVDFAEDGCTNGGFGPGYENGLGIECGSVLASARIEARAALRGASHE